MILRSLFLGWYTVGLLLMYFFTIPSWLTFANSIFLVLYALYVIQLAAGAYSKRSSIIWICLLIGILTFGIEVVGIQTGFPFGSYHYEQTLGFLVFGVPLPIAAAWIGVILNALLFSTPRSKIKRALETGLWVVVLDLILDPVAFSRHFWTWSGHGAYFGVPFTNFAGWLVIAGLLTFLFPLKPMSKAVRIWAVRIFQLMLFMFGVLAVKAGLQGVGALSIGFILLCQGRLHYDYRRKKTVI